MAKHRALDFTGACSKQETVTNRTTSCQALSAVICSWASAYGVLYYLNWIEWKNKRGRLC